MLDNDLPRFDSGNSSILFHIDFVCRIISKRGIHFTLLKSGTGRDMQLGADERFNRIYA